MRQKGVDSHWDWQRRLVVIPRVGVLLKYPANVGAIKLTTCWFRQVVGSVDLTNMCVACERLQNVYESCLVLETTS